MSWCTASVCSNETASLRCSRPILRPKPTACKRRVLDFENCPIAGSSLLPCLFQKDAVIHYRDDETMYVQALPDRVVVIFSTVFKDADDVIIGKVFLQVYDMVRPEELMARVLKRLAVMLTTLETFITFKFSFLHHRNSWR